MSLELMPDLVFDLGSHEGCKPPGHDLGPQGWMNNVECLEVLLIPGGDKTLFNSTFMFMLRIYQVLT